MPKTISSGRIVSINTGTPRTLTVPGSRPFRTGYLKNPIAGKIYLDFLGLANDQVADPRVHGGPDKAVCAYPLDHYAYWEQNTGKALKPGAFGENFTLEGMTESVVGIGDIFQAGEAKVMCSQPRQPCHKLNKVFQIQEMACRIKTSGFTGFYFKVLEPGWVSPDDRLTLLEKGEGCFSVEEMNRFLFRDNPDQERLQQACELKALSADWVRLLRKRRVS